MSWQAVTWVLEQSQATLGSRLVLLSIASHANREGKNAFPALDTIGRETLMSRREIIYAVQSLEELGELRVKRGIGRGNPNVYELPFVGSWLEKVQSLHQLADAKGALKMRKGAISARKGAISAPKSDLTPLDTVISETERLEPSKVLKVKDILIRSCIPEPPKTQTEQQLLAKLKRDRERLKELGYLQ